MNAGTVVVIEYVDTNGRMVAKQTGSDIYYIKDVLGSTRQVWKSGANKAAFSVATYAPFGTPVSASGTEKFEYAGEMHNSKVGSSPGLYYIFARYMDPQYVKKRRKEVLELALHCLTGIEIRDQPSGSQQA